MINLGPNPNSPTIVHLKLLATAINIEKINTTMAYFARRFG